MLQTTLYEWEQEQGKALGMRRYDESRRMGLKQIRQVTDQDKYSIDILGAQGEIAVAKALNLRFVPTVNTFHAADVGVNIQVRTVTPVYRYGRLIVRPNDPDEHIYVLVRCPEKPEFQIIGWVFGYEAKRDEWLMSYDGKPPVYFVPNHSLRPIETLFGHEEYLKNVDFFLD